MTQNVSKMNWKNLNPNYHIAFNTYLDQIQNDYRVSVSLGKIFKMKSGSLIRLVLPWYWKPHVSHHDMKSKITKLPCNCTNTPIISGLRFKREVSWDQKSGIDPRFCTTELICREHSCGESSNIICSVSTSLATCPFSFTPRFKYLDQKWKYNIII